MKIDWTKVKEGITTMDILKEENKELKNRIDKAIEYIKIMYEDEYISYGDKEELIGILKGSDKE